MTFRRKRKFGAEKVGKGAMTFLAQAMQRHEPVTPREKEKIARAERLGKDPESIFDLLDEMK